MRLLIVDDEPLARHELRYLLEGFEQVGQVLEADDEVSTLAIVQDEAIDGVFLDIHLTAESGLDVAKKINQLDQPPMIIFATAYDEYALKAFERNARDYIMKPFDQARVKQAVMKLHKALEQQTVSDSASEPATLQQKPTELPLESAAIPIYSDDRFQLVKPRDIMAIEVQQGSIILYLMNKVLTTQGTLKEWEEKLSNDPFLRVHRSYMIHIDHIKEIQPWFNNTYQVIMSDELKIPVSRTYLKTFKQVIGL